MDLERTSCLSGTSAVALLAASLCFAAAPIRGAGAQHDDAAKLPLQTCPVKSGSGAGIVAVTILFSVSDPIQDVTCTYSEDSDLHFQVDKGCDVEPMGTIADGIGAGGTGFSFGRHECRESEPGAGKCRIVCPRK
jgi:hypothetical protein